jgi:hypothetical protein
MQTMLVLMSWGSRLNSVRQQVPTQCLQAAGHLSRLPREKQQWRVHMQMAWRCRGVVHADEALWQWLSRAAILLFFIWGLLGSCVPSAGPAHHWSSAKGQWQLSHLK